MIGECYVGDVRDGLQEMIAVGIRAQTCVTSPPYWGLRDYGTAQWDGGDPGCSHLQKVGGTKSSTLGLASGGHDMSDEARIRSTERSFVPYAGYCRKCGAVRIDRQIGLEPMIAEYVSTMVDVFRLVRDVLADDGTLWLNLGDSYAGGGRGGNPDNSPFRKQATNRGSLVSATPLGPGMKPKDLCGIPWRVAFALQADGWYLRSDIIWAKPNPMPESVTDRPTKAHEYLFLMSKRERYYYDAEAIKEPVNGTAHRRGIKMPDGWDTGAGTHGPFHRLGREKGKTRGVTPKSAVAGSGIRANESFHAATPDLVDIRNRRSVWTIATEPYPDAHFATFPTALVEPCILAGSRVGDVVLDPFLGSGTVAHVAQAMGRKWVGCELNPAYVVMQKKRAAQHGLELA